MASTTSAGFYRDALLRDDACHKLRARSAAGSDAIRAARPLLREYSAVDAELVELDLMGQLVMDSV